MAGQYSGINDQELGQEQVVHFFHQVLGIAAVSKEVLSERTNDYQQWVAAYSRNHGIPIERAGKGVRKEEYVLPALSKIALQPASQQFRGMMVLPPYARADSEDTMGVAVVFI